LFVQVWKFCRLLDPAYVGLATMQNLHADIMCHTSIKVLGDAAEGLKAELAAYKVTATGVQADCDLCGFWRTHGSLFPNLNAAAKIAATIQPSSAAAERVFAMLKWMFTKQQGGTHEDYKVLSLLLRYNECWRLKVEKARLAIDEP